MKSRDPEHYLRGIILTAAVLVSVVIAMAMVGVGGDAQAQISPMPTATATFTPTPITPTPTPTDTPTPIPPTPTSTDTPVPPTPTDTPTPIPPILTPTYTPAPNVPPAVGAIAAPKEPVNFNNQPITVSAVYTDPSVLNDTYTAAWAWGDDSSSSCRYPVSDDVGNPEACSIINTTVDNEFRVTGSHVYTDPGIFQVVLTVTAFEGDSERNSDMSSVEVEVVDDNVPPTVGAIAAPMGPVNLILDQPIAVSAVYTDPSVLDDTHTAAWAWGDGITTPGIVNETNGSGSVTGSHTYLEPGVYTVGLTVTDSAGASDTSSFEYVIVYDPNGGFVTGGGWINSLSGAYKPAPTLTGKATFGFVSKYKKGATKPSGNTQFQFKAGNLKFHSNSYDWLVIAGHKATYKGTGTVNGAGDYGFELSATDADLTPSADLDRIHIKIWDKNTENAIIYDNQMGDADDADASTEIGGGSIVIHKAKKK